MDDIPPSGLQPRRADASSWAAGWAQFSGGEAFTLGPEARTDGWVRRLRAIGGNDLFRLGGEFSAEERNDRAAPALRVSLQVGM